MEGANTTRSTRKSRRIQERNISAESTTQSTEEGAEREACDCCLLPFKGNQHADKRIARVETCIHRFHFSCIKKWSELETTCPQCKAVFTTIERLCPKTNRVIETGDQIKCDSLFLWDHQEDGGGAEDNTTSIPHEEAASPTPEDNSESSPNRVLQLLSPLQVDALQSSKKRKKAVEVKEAVIRTEKHLKRMAMNDVCYAPPTVPYAMKPMSIPIKQNTEFNLKPVYQEDFIAK